MGFPALDRICIDPHVLDARPGIRGTTDTITGPPIAGESIDNLFALYREFERGTSSRHYPSKVG
jgi:hypothetical protein